MPKIVTVAEMKAIEKAADAAGHSYEAMMDHAGKAVAERILNKMAILPDARVLILVGPGNNGGDSLVAGRYVKDLFPDSQVDAYLLKSRTKRDKVYKAAAEAGVSIITAEKDKDFEQLKELINQAYIVVDALFGTGTRLPIAGKAGELLQAVHEALQTRHQNYPRNRAATLTGSPGVASFESFQNPDQEYTDSRPLILAVDCPSGMNCDSGEVDELTLKADETITFAAVKPGLLTFPGAAYVGELFLGNIGLPEDMPELENITLEMADVKMVSRILPECPLDAHKGTFGKAFLVTGSLNYIGAAALAAGSAYRVGAGLITVGVPQVILTALAAQTPEATWIVLPHNMGVVNEGAAKIVRKEIKGYRALLVGPGIGNEDDSRNFLKELLDPKDAPGKSRKRIGFGLPIGTGDSDEEKENTEEEATHLPPLVIDADGLNVLAQIDDWWTIVPENTIITPHPMEFARLAKMEDEKDSIQANRIQMAREKAAEWKVIVVLKGAFTVVAAPDGSVCVSPFATPNLATAGTGDVLAGAITGLIAQGVKPYEAVIAGVWLHGYAGAESYQGRSTVASDVMNMLVYAIERVEEEKYR